MTIAPTHEPVGQEHRKYVITHADRGADDHDAERRIEPDRRGSIRCCGEPERGGRGADRNDKSRPPPVHQHPDHGRQHHRRQKANRERRRRHAPLPAELIENWRKQKRESGPDVDRDCHGYERNDDYNPAGMRAGDTKGFLRNGFTSRTTCKYS